MRLETFFEKFELFADAPNAVGKLRELVLELAVRGRLTDQESNDFNNASLLTPSLRPVAKGHCDGAEADLPFGIPQSWRWLTLSELGDTKPRNDACDSADVSFVPMAFIPAEFGRDVQHKVRRWNEIKKGYTHFADGDVVMAKITPCYENGKSAVIRHLAGGIGAGSTELHVFRPSPEAILSQYVLIYLKSRGFIERGVPRMTGSAGQKRVSHAYFAKSPFPLPPLAEQKRIVAKVDELMALCDRLEARQQERDTHYAALARASLARFADAPTPANLDFLFHQSYAIPPAELRKAILSLAVQGKLVPQDPDDVSAEQTLGQVLLERNRLAKSLRVKEPSPVMADDEHMPSLPCGWCYASPDQLTEFHKNALSIGPFGSSLLKSDYTADGVPLVFVRDIRSGTFGGVETRCVSNAKGKELASHTVRSGDLLITKMGDPPGDTAIYPEGRPPAIITADCIKLSTHHDVVTAEYLKFAVRAPQLTEQFAGITLGVAQQKVSLGRFRCIAVPLPPLAEQRRIVAKVDQLMAMVDQLEAQLAKTKAKSTALLDAIIHELLNPSAEIIDLATYRAAIGCYAIRKMGSKRYFGRTAAMKVFYLAQAHVGLELGLHPMREAAGPLDPWIYRFEEQGERNDWFKAVETTTASGKKKIEYRPGQRIAEQSAQAERLLSASERKDFDRLFGLLADKKTDEAEIIATLFAAWNDFLIDGQTPGDDEIVTEVREHWHESKQRFTPQQLRQWLAWMRDNDLVPKGKLPRTVHQTDMFAA